VNNSILLTGGFGNIGGRLAALLSNRADLQLHLGSRSARTAPNWAPQAAATRLDLLDVGSIESAVSGINTIVHLAALNDIESAKNPNFAHELNVVGTHNLVDCAIDAGVERLIYMSTAHVYGSPIEGRISESHPTAPVHPYAVTHLGAERIVADAHDAGKIVGIRIRSANGFGAPMDPTVKIWQILVNDLCRQASQSHELILKTHGSQERNFVPLTDVCEAIEHLIGLDASVVGDGLFNFGADTSHSIWEMANRIADRCEHVLGFKPPITRPAKPIDKNHDRLDYRSDKIKRTGFIPKLKFDDEIDGLLQFCAQEFPFIR